MKNKLKREVQKELLKYLESERLQDISLPSTTDEKNNLTNSKGKSVLKRKIKQESEDSDSETTSSDDDENSDSESTDDSEIFKSKRSRKNKKCSCSKNLKYFKSQFKKLVRTQKIILTEIENIQSEVLKNSSQNNEHNYSMLDDVDNFEILGLPCLSFESFMAFELQCKESNEAEQCLRDIFKKVKENDLTKYIRTCMKRILIDDIAIYFTWYGFQNNVAVKDFTIIRILKNACLAKFTNSREDEVLKVIKKWFHYAKDRIRKLEKRQIDISNI